MRQKLFLVLGLLLATAAHGAMERIPNELLVKLRDTGPGARVQAQVLSRLQSALGSTAIASARPLRTDHSLQLIRLARDEQVGKALQLLAAEPSIAYAEPNQRVHAFRDGLPNDPELYRAWSLRNTGQMGPGSKGDVNVLPLWREGVVGSRKTVVAVIDTGIEWSHPDLAANLYTNPKPDAGNGFVGDVHGWNFYAGNADSRDDNGHGSHCAGIIGAAGDNGVGTAGVNWNVSLLPVKFLGADGSGSLAHAIEAINYARLMKADVMSNSWGGGGYSQALKEAIEKARDAGILFVAAAGNEGRDNDASPTYPASYAVDNVVAVASTDYRDQVASSSNYGRRSVHLAAPGVKVFSTYKGGEYTVLSGTSMAAPHVAGAAALLRSARADWDYTELKRRLIEGAEPTQGLRGKVAARGRLNVYNAYLGVKAPNAEPDERLWKTTAQVYESAHPYANREDSRVRVTVPGARFVRVHFDRFELESTYDKVTVETPDGETLEELTGALTDRTSEYVAGDTLVLHLTSDYSNVRFGFHVDRVQSIGN